MGEATYGPGSDTALATSARAAAQRNIEQSVSPRDTPTVPVALTRMDLQRMADAAPGRKIVPVMGTLQVQDDLLTVSRPALFKRHGVAIVGEHFTLSRRNGEFRQWLDLEGDKRLELITGHCKRTTNAPF